MTAGCREHCLPLLAEIVTLAASEDQSHILRGLLDLVLRYTGADQGSVMVLDGLGELTIVAARGLEETVRREARVKPGEGVAGWVVRTGSPLWVEDIRRDSRFCERGEEWYPSPAFLSCPLPGLSGPLGVLNVAGRADGKPFSSRDFSLVRIVAGIAGVVLGKEILFQTLEAVGEELAEARKRLVASNEARAAFVARVSHELRTPLHVIKGAVYALTRPGPETPVDQSDFLAIISAEVDNLIAMAEQELARLEV